MHAEVKQLAPAIRRALEGVRYGRSDAELIAAEGVEPAVAGGDGMRGFVIAVNLETGERQGFHGSWGGSNMFAPDNAVDNAFGTVVTIPENGVVIKGTTGAGPTYAAIYAHPNAIGKFLPSGEEEELTSEEQQCLYCFGSIKGGEYRRDEIRRRDVSAQTVASLVQRGYLKSAKNGATSITTKGKNARTIHN